MLELNTFENKVLGSAENLPFEDNSFDNVFVVSYGVMYQTHIKLLESYMVS